MGHYEDSGAINLDLMAPAPDTPLTKQMKITIKEIITNGTLDVTFINKHVGNGSAEKLHLFILLRINYLIIH